MDPNDAMSPTYSPEYRRQIEDAVQKRVDEVNRAISARLVAFDGSDDVEKFAPGMIEVSFLVPRDTFARINDVWSLVPPDPKETQ